MSIVLSRKKIIFGNWMIFQLALVGLIFHFLSSAFCHLILIIKSCWSWIMIPNSTHKFLAHTHMIKVYLVFYWKIKFDSSANNLHFRSIESSRLDNVAGIQIVRLLIHTTWGLFPKDFVTIGISQKICWYKNLHQDINF